MNRGFSIEGQEATPIPEEQNHAEVKKSSWSKATLRYKELMNAVDETERLDFRERPAVDPEDKIIAQLELEIDGCKGEAEKCAQQNDPNGEKAMRMLAQFKEAEKTLLCLYFDAKNISPEFADLLVEEHPWLGERLPEEEQLPQPEHVD